MHGLSNSAMPARGKPQEVPHKTIGARFVPAQSAAEQADLARKVRSAERKSSRSGFFATVEGNSRLLPTAAGRRDRRSAVIQDGAIMFADFSAALLAAVAAALLRFGNLGGVDSNGLGILAGSGLALLGLGWVVAIAAVGGYQRKLFGSGTEEYRRLVRAALYFGGAMCIVLYASNSSMSRMFVFTATILALVFNFIIRTQTRRLVLGAWKAGRGTSGVVLLGSGESVPDLAERLQSAADSGYRVVGACIPAAQRVDPELRHRLTALNVPVLGTPDDIVSVVRSVNAHAVIVTTPAELGSRNLRRIAWELEKTEAELMVSTGLEQVAGHRVRVRQAGRAGLLQIDQPMYSGTKRVLKSISDRIVAVFALIGLAPVFLALAIAVRLDSKGPALFVQTRIGRDKKPFKMVKFRSMYADAEESRAAVMAAEAATEGAPDRGPMAKSKEDPRITKVGRFIRRTSLDELPQLINVITGTMSLVGPRPALPHEVDAYEVDATRRLLVRPGMTGLWQVSGRSDLDWIETVRLDLHYVENWSSTMDLSIMARTIKAVTRSTGAY